MGRDGEQTPRRTCLACGRKAPQAELLRLVLREGRVTPDPRRLLPGRGAYICPRLECAQSLGRGKRSHRVFKRSLPAGAWEGFFAWPEIAALPQGRGGSAPAQSGRAPKLAS